MEIEAIRGLIARNQGPYLLQMADGSTVEVASERHMALPPTELREARTIVVYGPSAGQFKLLDAFMVVAASPAPPPRSKPNGH